MPVTRMPEVEPYLRALFYGFTGAGKTWLMGSGLDVPSFAPMLFVDVDAGTLSIRDRKDDENLYYWRLYEYSEMNEVYDMLVGFEAYKKRHPDVPLPDEPFKSIVIDDLSELYFYGLNWVISEDKRKKHPDRDMLQPQLQDYGKARLMMHKLLRHFRSLPMHFICAAQAGQVRDEVTGKLEVGLDMVGQLSDEVPVFFDIVGYLAVSRDDPKKFPRGRRQLVLQPISRLRAKDRATDILDTKLLDPTMLRIVEHCPHIETGG